MKLSVGARALGVAAVSASLLAMPLTVSASAVTQPGTCKKLTTKSAGAGKVVATVSQCTPLSATGGSGSGPAKAGQTSGTITTTFTWAQKKGTTGAQVKLNPQSTPRRCPTGSQRITITGHVTGGTGVAGRTFTKGQPITGSICVNAKTTNASTEPGTVLKF